MFKARHLSLIAILSVLVLSAAGAFRVSAQRQRTNKTNRPSAANPDDVVDLAPSEMRPVIEYYLADRGSLLRSYPVADSPARRERFRKFCSDALDRIQKLNFDSMSQEGKVDYILFRNHLEHELRQLEIEEKLLAEVEPLLPFAKTIIDLEVARRRMEPMDSAKTAAA